MNIGNEYSHPGQYLWEGGDSLESYDYIDNIDTQLKLTKKPSKIRALYIMWQKRIGAWRYSDALISSYMGNVAAIRESNLMNWEIGLTIRDPALPRIIRCYLHEHNRLGIMIRRIREDKDYFMLLYLTACAMELGCILPEGHLEFMKTVVWEIYLEAGANAQVRIALDKYENGVPYLFQQPDLEAPIGEDVYWNDETEVECPGLEDGPMLAWPSLNGGRPLLKDFHLPANVCANCARRACKDGTPLKRCKRCKRRLYCSWPCQKRNWDPHNQICCAPPPMPASDMTRVS